MKKIFNLNETNEIRNYVLKDFSFNKDTKIIL